MRGIAPLFTKQETFLQSAVTRTAFSDNAPAGRIVHVATHAQADTSTRCIRASCSRAGAQPADGPDSLLAQDIYNLKFDNVALVTLSACETALGRIERGDEIMGFTRAFFYAGASGLIVSMWPVSDESTALTMRTFYGNLTRGDEAIDALRQAQLAVLADPRFSHPFYWAPFDLMGSWGSRWRARTSLRLNDHSFAAPAPRPASPLMTPHAKAHSGGPRVPRLAQNVLAMTLACASATAAFAQQAPNAGTLLNEQAPPKPEAPSPGSGGTLRTRAPSTNEAAGASAQPGKTFSCCTASTFRATNSCHRSAAAARVGQDRADGVARRSQRDRRARCRSVSGSRLCVAQVVIPPQDVTSGDVTFTVLEGKIGHVRVNVAAGAPIRESAVVARLAAIRPGEPLRQRDLERTMLLLSDLPGLPSLSIEAGSVPGTVDLTVNVEAARRWEFAVSGDEF